MLKTTKNKTLQIVIGILITLQIIAIIGFLLEEALEGSDKMPYFAFSLVLWMFIILAYVGMDREPLKILLCSQCRAENRVNAKFCDNCGSSLV